MTEIWLKVTVICIWILLASFYFGGLYSQRQNLSWYLPCKSKIKILGAISTIFGWLAIEIGFYTVVDHYLTSIWVILSLFALLVLAPLWLTLQIKEIYVDSDPSKVIPAYIKNWKHFGPYLTVSSDISHSLSQSQPQSRFDSPSQPKMSILWAVAPSLIQDPLKLIEVGSSLHTMDTPKISSNLTHSCSSCPSYPF